MQQTANSASLDTMLDMLRDSHRRRILLAVSNHNPRTEGEVTTDSFTPDEIGEDEIEELKTQLRHVHLPKMADKVTTSTPMTMATGSR